MCTQMVILGFPGSSVVKNPPAVQEIWVQYLDREDPLAEEMATHSSKPAWEILWTRSLASYIQAIGSQTVRHD